MLLPVQQVLSVLRLYSFYNSKDHPSHTLTCYDKYLDKKTDKLECDLQCAITVFKLIDKINNQKN